MPVILPHDLLPLLVSNNGFQEAFGTSPEDIAAYWRHCAKHMSWAKDHPAVAHADGATVPVFLYGDDTQMNENGDKMTVLMMGCCLDERTNSMMTHFPLFIYREAWFVFLQPLDSRSNAEV